MSVFLCVICIIWLAFVQQKLDKVSRTLDCLVKEIYKSQKNDVKKPLQEDIRWDGVALGADTSKNVRRLITFSGHVMELEPLEPSRHF